MDNRRPVISHYGVKGMRWGVRNEDQPIGSFSKIKPVPNAASVETKNTAATSPDLEDPNALKVAREKRLQAKELRLRKEAGRAKVETVLKAIGTITVAAFALNMLRSGAISVAQAMQRSRSFL